MKNIFLTIALLATLCGAIWLDNQWEVKPSEIRMHP